MLRHLPWQYVVRKAARSLGFMDPAAWLARVRQFSQPSEVQEPIELLRAGIIFHARGLVNTKAIQHNLDWVWPYWVERQFDPHDLSFIPRAFSFSHINLTHRNWTAVGLPDLALYPIVDPRGLVTPLHDGWSLDFWLFGPDGNQLLPSRLDDEHVQQRLITETSLVVETIAESDGLHLAQTTELVCDGDEPTLQICLRARCLGHGQLVVAIRPYNPEGVQFIDHIQSDADRRTWRVNDRTNVIVSRGANQSRVSRYDRGDVFHHVGVDEESSLASEIRCDTGMATAAAFFDFDDQTELTVHVSLGDELRALGNAEQLPQQMTWPVARSEAAQLQVPDEKIQSLYRTAVDSLMLLSADEIVPGPYTYRRFWFRDACLMMHSMLAIGMIARCHRALERFPARQTRRGYFLSQKGEWDSNGQVLWIADRFVEMTGHPLPPNLLKVIDRAVDWIDRKRVHAAGKRHDGLLPPGFSAEHLGTNDYYYWDDYWALAGLKAAARIYRREHRHDRADRTEELAIEMDQAIATSIGLIPKQNSLGGIPASPYRRMDSGAIGSLVVDYPLQLCDVGDPRVLRTIDALMQRSFYKGGFFQEMIHSGINAYLTLDIAQTLLRAGDCRYRDLVQTVANLASPTGHWPEAIHPKTGGGCMGDGQHGWAAAEWAMMIRNCFVREEQDRLIIGSGIFGEWLEGDADVCFGPTLTRWGSVSIRIIRPETSRDDSPPRLLMIDAHWHGESPHVDILVPGYEPQCDVNTTHTITLCETFSNAAHR